MFLLFSYLVIVRVSVYLWTPTTCIKSLGFHAIESNGRRWENEDW